MPKFSKFQREISALLDAGTNVIWVVINGDEALAEDQLRHLITGMLPAPVTDDADDHDGYIQDPDYPGRMYQLPDRHGEVQEVLGTFSVWSCVDGATWCSGTDDPNAAVQHIANIENRDERAPVGVVVLRDMAAFLNHAPNVKLRRILINNVVSNEFASATHPVTVIIVTRDEQPHADIRDCVSVVDFPLPTLSEMSALVDETYERGKINKPDLEQPSQEDQETLARAMLGLPAMEARRAISHAYIAAGGKLDQSIVPTLQRAKALAIRKIAGLEIIPARQIPSLDKLGAFDTYIAELAARKHTYSADARRLGIPRPRGYTLIGPSGTGKTVAAKATAAFLGLDLIVLDIGSMFDSLLGNTEKRIREALATVSAMKSGVLLIDEIDKSLSGAHMSGASDAGASARVVSSLLTWMSERDTRYGDDMIFIMLTMNRIDGMPPELQRPGRIDKVWGTSLPNEAERRTILDIHLGAYGGGVGQFTDREVNQLVKNTETFSGADIEEVVKRAVITQYAVACDAGNVVEPSDVPPTPVMLLNACAGITPLATIMPEEQAKMAEWTAKHAAPVAGPVRTNTGARKTRSRQHLGTPQISDN